MAIVISISVVSAATDVDYLDENGDEQIAATTTDLVGGGATTLNSGWYSVSGNAVYTGTITISGDVHIILMNSSHLSVTGSASNAGINVAGTNSPTIYAQSTNEVLRGKLTATGGQNGGAGIGGGNNQDGGSITIIGGEITANGGPNGAAAIGGGGAHNLGNTGGAGGTIVIIGGTVIANGGDAHGGRGGGAGIGSGGAFATSLVNGLASKPSGSITIGVNAVVIATGGSAVYGTGSGGAGIGSGGADDNPGPLAGAAGDVSNPIIIESTAIVTVIGGVGQDGRNGAAIGHGGGGTTGPGEETVCKEDWKITTPATCTTPGHRVKECIYCGKIFQTESIPTIPHNHGTFL